MIQGNSTDKVEIRKGCYDSGALMWEIPYVNGEIHGIAKDYYESGALRCETPYVNGKEHGIAKDYRESGTLRRETPYVDGDIHGIEKWYYESGTLKKEVPYVKGNIHGIVKSYEEDRMCISRLALYHVGVRRSTLGNPICEWKVVWNGAWDSEGILRISGAL